MKTGNPNGQKEKSSTFSSPADGEANSNQWDDNIFSWDDPFFENWQDDSSFKNWQDDPFFKTDWQDDPFFKNWQNDRKQAREGKRK